MANHVKPQNQSDLIESVLHWKCAQEAEGQANWGREKATALLVNACSLNPSHITITITTSSARVPKNCLCQGCLIILSNATILRGKDGEGIWAIQFREGLLQVFPDYT